MVPPIEVINQRRIIMDKVTLDGVASGAIDPEQHKKGQKSANAADVSAIKECVEVLKQCARIITDIVQAFCDILLMPDGQIKDISDKEGRNALRQELLAVNKNIEVACKAMKDLPSRLQKATPSSVAAKLDDGDRKLLEQFVSVSRTRRIIDFVLGAVIGILFIVASYKNVVADNRKAQLEQWRTEQQDAIDFGRFMVQRNPGTYKYWKSGEWKRDSESSSSR